jgi:hypothetical protein
VKFGNFYKAKISQFFFAELSVFNKIKKPSQMNIRKGVKREGGGNRTHDQRIKSPLLYQLSYTFFRVKPFKIGKIFNIRNRKITGNEISLLPRL